MKLVSLLVLALTESVLMQKCPTGTFKIIGKCEDENECEFEDPICGNDAYCTNTEGSYYCQCHEGFKPPGIFTAEDSISCQDINECVENTVACGPNAKCHNYAGNYACLCSTGYISSNGKDTFVDGEGIQCIDINECENSDYCGKMALCHNIPGGFYCTCAPGFRLKSGQTNFTDVTESCESVCDIDAFICNVGKEGHECVWKSGFTNYGDENGTCTGNWDEAIWIENCKDYEGSCFQMLILNVIFFVICICF